MSDSNKKIEVFSIKNVAPGMIVSQDIKDKKGFLLVTSNMELNVNLIKKLVQFGVTEVPVFVSQQESNIPINNINLNEVFRNQILSNISSSMIYFIKHDQYTSRIIDLMTDLTKDDILMSLLIEIKTIGYDVFLHSINVFMLSSLIGLKNNFPIDRMIVLAQAALLHDIGKKFLPAEILEKAPNLNAEEIKTFEQHSLFSFEYLQTVKGIPYEVSRVVYEHHERIDGGGYPQKLQRENIHKLAQVISLADAFDTAIGSKVTNSRKIFAEAIEFLEGAGNIYFNYEFAKCLLEELSAYRLYDWVILNNDDIGIVTKIYDNIPLRPVVTVFYDKFKQKYSFPKQMDLTTKAHANVFIKNVLD